jgi:Anticodon-binding domain of tRNA ligase
MPVSDRIYVSDADAQSATDLETLRMGRHLVDDLGSRFPGKRKRTLASIRKHVLVSPVSMMPLLLRFLEHTDPEIRSIADQLVEETISTPKGEQALIECLFSAHHVVSINAAELLERKGLGGEKFREIYASSEKLFAKCKALEIYTADIKDLFIDSIELYKKKAVEQATGDIVLAHDLLQDRLEWNENLKRYITDVLRLSPQLSQSGVSMDNIQASLKTIAGTMKTRDYKETRDLVEGKKMEAAIGSELSSAFSFISKRMKNVKIDPQSQIPDEDKWIFEGMRKLAGEIKTSMGSDGKVEAMRSVYSFVAQELAGRYLEHIAKRIEKGDAKAAAAAGSAMLGMTKILALVLPNVASELYDDSLKALVGKDDLDDVAWPNLLSDIEKP